MTTRVLLMDDEPSIGEISEILLKKLGYDSVITVNAGDTVSSFKSAYEEGNPFDVVILDLTIMGDIGGAEVIKLLLEIDPTVKALVSSGDRFSPFVTDFKGHGFSGVLNKPYNKAALDEAIKSLID